MQFFSCKKEIDSRDSAYKSLTTDNSTVNLATHLVAWYTFTNGDSADFSGNNNNLSFRNVTLAAGYSGTANSAYLFDGSTSYMRAANSTTLNPSTISICVLFKPLGFYQGSGGLIRILMKGEDDQTNGIYYVGYSNTGTAYGTFGNNQFNSAGVSDPNVSFQLNQWYKLIYTYDGNVAKLYINGQLVNSNTTTASFTPNADPLRIGKTGRQDFRYWFNGAIGEIRIYNKALSKTQVVQVTGELGN